MHLLSIATRVHTMVHLKNNKLWSTLCEKPQSHEEMVDRCEKHLVYLSFGILKKRSPPILETMPILGTVLSDDSATQRELIHSVGMKIKPESAFTGTTPTSKLARLPKARAASGSAVQLERVEAEMKVDAIVSYMPYGGDVPF